MKPIKDCHTFDELYTFVLHQPTLTVDEIQSLRKQVTELQEQVDQLINELAKEDL